MMDEHAEVRRMLRDSAGEFARSRLASTHVRELRDVGPDAAHALWREMAELGWSGLMVDAERGGSGLGLREMAVVLEELGRAAAPQPLAACAVLGACVLAASEPSPLRDEVLAGLADGSLVPAVAGRKAHGLGHPLPARRSRKPFRADGRFVAPNPWCGPERTGADW
ncbi:acyl-CoA dehydrogenase family protein [Ramlibacter terrae]|uniref:Acyl-CoA dehydrogenase family protein n=1 Tax=Ramlibacter terrae TaxID=2732511 RepID=A0ABX6P6U4_9BURK|nr:acyl-CoA dehydrogenase family protein [Ramlibacter terrae]